MKKNECKHREQLLERLKNQKISSIDEIESYHLSPMLENCAGMDLGSKSNYLAIDPQVAAEMDVPIVHEFSTFTSGHQDCLRLLQALGVKHVVMESTGVYWRALYSTLVGGGIEVCLVNPKKFRMVPGRKTDVLDCQWLQTLYKYGLVTGSFIPAEKVSMLRTFINMRDNIMEERNRCYNRMLKAMTEMNIMLKNVISDLMGENGQRIIRAILDGERDSRKLSELCDRRLKADKETIASSLEGTYREDRLYLLRFNFDEYNRKAVQMEEIDSEIEQLLLSFEAKGRDGKTAGECLTEDNGEKPTKKKSSPNSKNEIRTKVDKDELLSLVFGVNPMTISGIGSTTTIRLLATVGPDLSMFPDAKHFVGWLGLAPRNKITGGRLISSKTDRLNSMAANAFKNIVPSVSLGKSAFSSFYHRKKGQIGTAKAITATARKIAVSFYNCITYGSEFVEQGKAMYEEKQRERRVCYFKKLAQELGAEVIMPEKLAS